MGRYKELAITIAESLAKLDMTLNDSEPAENIYPIRRDAVKLNAPVFWTYLEFYDHMLNGSLDEFLEPEWLEAYQPDGLHPLNSALASAEDILRNFGDEGNRDWNLFTETQMREVIKLNDAFMHAGMPEPRRYNSLAKPIGRIKRLQAKYPEA